MEKNINYFKYVNNFEKISKVKSTLIRGVKLDYITSISIVIPTYKRERLLKDAIESVLIQNCEFGYELIVIDNDPTRNCKTEKLINSFNNREIKYYKNTENIGMISNWNRGIELSNSKWVVLLHDDDIMSPFFINYIVPLLSMSSAAIIKPLDIKFNDIIPRFEYPKTRSLRKITLINFMFGCAVGAPTNIILNKDRIIELGGFNSDYFPTSDYVFASMCSKKFDVFILPVYLGAYRVSESESLKESTMINYFINRYLISSFIMRKYRIPDKVINFIYSALFPYFIKSTNAFYNVRHEFDFVSQLGLKKTSRFNSYIVKIGHTIFNYSLILKGKFF